MPVSMEQALEEQRKVNRVRLVQGDEIGESIKHLPGGVYGNTFAPAAMESGLFAKPSYHAYEVHITPEKEVLIIAFVTPEMKDKLEKRTELTEVAFYPAPVEEATECISIPFKKLAHPKQPNRMDNNQVKGFLHP